MTNEGEVAAGLAPSANYRYAELVGDRLLVAGQVPLDGSGELVGREDPAIQAVRCLDNLRTLVEHHGFGVGDIRRLTVYVVGRHEHLLAAWDAVVDWFGGEVPPATLLGVNLLGYRHQLVEIDAEVLRAS